MAAVSSEELKLQKHLNISVNEKKAEVLSECRDCAEHKTFYLLENHQYHSNTQNKLCKHSYSRTTDNETASQVTDTMNRCCCSCRARLTSNAAATLQTNIQKHETGSVPFAVQ